LATYFFDFNFSLDFFNFRIKQTPLIRHSFVFFAILFSIFHGCQSPKKTDFLIHATGYGAHVELSCQKIPDAKIYTLWGSIDGKEFTERARTSDTLFLDFVKDLGENLALTYRIEAQTDSGITNLGTATATVKPLSDEQLLDMVAYYTFRYFWNGAEPNSGMAPERIHLDGEYPDNDAHIITTGGTGMGLIGILGGIDGDWISREQFLARFEKILTFLENADRWHGIWPHWLDGRTGKVKPFSQKDDGADLVESAFLMQGLLVVREYFKNGNMEEKSISERIDRLWREMDWDFHTNGKPVLYWHWSPNFGWEMNFPLEGYNECLITYALAAASPTHSIDPQAYHLGWARNGKIKAEKAGGFGYPLQLRHNGAEDLGGPLFWAHYSYLSLNPKDLKDCYADYWQENVNQTLINRACVSKIQKNSRGMEKIFGG
jgi:hypothetical protein